MRAETEAGLAAVSVAQELMARRVGADHVASKGGRDLVTETDLAVEDAVRAILGERFPAWTVVGEERGGQDRVGDRPYWLVDPICGTRNFASNVPLYAVNVALVEDGVLPLLPAYRGYMTGLSADELATRQDAATRAHVLGRSLAFVLGLSAVFTALGASASCVGQALL